MLTTSIRQRRCEEVRSTPRNAEAIQAEQAEEMLHFAFAHAFRLYFGDTARRLVAAFAGTLTSSVPILRSTHICCFHFFFEKVKGAQIFPAVFWLPHNLVRICFFVLPRFFSAAGKGVTGADVSPTAQGDDPLGNPRLAGALLVTAYRSAAEVVGAVCSAGVTCLRRPKGMIPLGIPTSLARSWVRRAEVR